MCTKRFREGIFFKEKMQRHLGKSNKCFQINKKETEHLLVKPKLVQSEWVWVNFTLSCLNEGLGQ